MINIKDLSKVIKQISDEKGLKVEAIIEAVESALASAYKKEYGNKSWIVKSKIDIKNGSLNFYQVKIVVDKDSVIFEDSQSDLKTDLKNQTKKDESIKEEDKKELIRFNPDRHILLEDALKIKPDAQVGEELTFALPTKDDFGRIAAQVAKQTILQKLHEAEKSMLLTEWKDKEGTIVSGIIQRFDRGNIYVDLGKTLGIVFPNDSIPGERYQAGDRMRFLVLAVQEDSRHPGIILSRSHPDFVKKLFELEVPEIVEGLVAIKGIVREAGSRTKIAVASQAPNIDAVGSLVGPRGARVMVVTNELFNERIDIVEWSEDPAQFIANALSPAKVQSVEILPKREAKVLVPEDQLSLAIGRNGQNIRLAAKLTNFKLDVRSVAHPDKVQEGGIAEVSQSEDMQKELKEETSQNKKTKKEKNNDKKLQEETNKEEDEVNNESDDTDEKIDDIDEFEDNENDLENEDYAEKEDDLKDEN
jgi:N utilization substance protein A